MAEKPFSLAVKAVIFDALAGATEFETPAAHVTGGPLRISEEHDASAWVPPACNRPERPISS